VAATHVSSHVEEYTATHRSVVAGALCQILAT
jgi:hypothetical protein